MVAQLRRDRSFRVLKRLPSVASITPRTYPITSFCEMRALVVFVALVVCTHWLNIVINIDLVRVFTPE